jgi:hypothetical protein
MLVNLVNAIGGIDVYSDYAFKSAVTDWTYEKGWNHCTGKKALYFARERKAFKGKDQQRIKNQQIVLKAIFKKITSSKTLLLNYGDILKAVDGEMQTDMPMSMISELVRNQLETGDEWTITSGDALAEVNMKGIQFVNTTDDYETGGTYQHVDFGETDVDGSGTSGFGLGLDLGAEYQVMEGLTVSAAVNDLGFINWSNIILLTQKKGQFEFDGFHDLAVKDANAAPGSTFKEQKNNYADQLTDFVSLQNQGDQGSESKTLAATANVGVEYQLPIYKPLTFGLLGQHHFNGDYSWTEGRLSANWSPLKWLNGGVNVAINNFCTSAGWVLNIHPSGFNFFIGMDHILGKTTKEFVPLSSNANLAVGMNVTF